METAEKLESGMDMQAMMEVYQKLATPGDPHELLSKMAGSWDTRSKCWMGPDEPYMETVGTSEQRMILGGRYLQQEFNSDMMWGPFNGLGILGYDNHTGKYVSTWVDTMSTGILFFEGTADGDGRTITQESRYDDPVLGPVTYRAVTRIVDDQTFNFEMYFTDKGGKEVKMMEMVYTRKG